jgi:hypothetical protein
MNELNARRMAGQVLVKNPQRWKKYSNRTNANTLNGARASE